jgi:hypothetical protein
MSTAVEAVRTMSTATERKEERKKEKLFIPK